MVARRNAADVEDQSALRRRGTLASRQREADLVAAMATPQLRRVMFDLIDRICNLHGGSYVESPTRTAYNEGKRAVGNALRTEIMAATPLDYVHMLDEQLKPERDDSVSSKPGVD